MSESPVSAAVADRLAGAAVSMHLATSVDDRPHVAPVWYLYEEGHLYAFTGGRKLENARTNPRVAASIEQTGSEHWLVVVRGTASIVEDRDRRREVARRLFVKYTDDPGGYTDENGDPGGTLVDVRIGSATLSTY